MCTSWFQLENMTAVLIIGCDFRTDQIDFKTIKLFKYIESECTFISGRIRVLTKALLRKSCFSLNGAIDNSETIRALISQMSQSYHSFTHIIFAAAPWYGHEYAHILYALHNQIN